MALRHSLFWEGKRPLDWSLLMRTHPRRQEMSRRAMPPTSRQRTFVGIMIGDILFHKTPGVVVEMN